MVMTFPIPFYRQPQLSIDTAGHIQQKYFEEDERILDDSVLDQSAIDSGLEMSPPMHFDGLQTDFEAATATMFQRTPMPLQSSPFGNAAGPMSGMYSSARGPALGSTAMATSSSMQGSGSTIVNASGSGVGATMSRKMLHSPTIRTHPELRRGDGIRKKNARFEIPAERNLNNIDLLISQTTDEQEIKELKQQKRLLRNRQAALDSRQRKKQHTERLEDEKKHYTAVINDMEQAMERLKLQVHDLLEEKEQYADYLKTLDLDKEDMVRRHTIETGELRKKISILSNHVQTLENAAVTMPNGQVAYADGTNAGVGVGAYGEMEGLSMGGTWEHVTLFSDMAGAEQQQQQQQQQPPAEIKQEMQQLLPASRKAANNAMDAAGVATGSVGSERPANQGGLLFMLFLVGAFVMSSRQAPSIPRVSEDVRVASAALLENVLKDAGVPSSTSFSAAGLTDATALSMPSQSASAVTSSWVAQADVASNGVVEPSMLGQLSDQLIQPTEQQTAEHMFSMSAAQYSSVVQHYEHPQLDRSVAAGGSGAPSRGRRNLAEALASMRVNSKAEVVTRSLLWDQIPSDVVHAFAKMFADSQGQQ
ncbi:bzip transcription factor [Grosmannia clavigera kw1407]|uniref:Bzip transcription factor n=1 Tax=Grosmannia clavigera (strain kw1407 / UAMH 11150) TaxID=655863 RepID=F0XR56_GROCL|nr:bzip transcription factor [Grosmannia clavigera kw1407]EFW99730.1 bzip transcription factor [Grosmannia clavigera kw1407]